MPRATWDDIGARLFHTGIDRGMLYTDVASVPWNGLVSVTESPNGGDAKPYYLDGQKILNIAAGEDFDGTIEAFFAPIEFASCVGNLVLSPALYATDQPRKTFNFSYRTLVGNDLSGINLAYKVHIVFNALASASDFTHGTLTDANNPQSYSWGITTSPVIVPGYRPTAHLVFDTRTNGDTVMSALENILYGNDTDAPRLPAVSEIVTLLAS